MTDAPTPVVVRPGTVEVLEDLLRSGGTTWHTKEQEWALRSAIEALSEDQGSSPGAPTGRGGFYGTDGDAHDPEDQGSSPGAPTGRGGFYGTDGDAHDPEDQGSSPAAIPTEPLDDPWAELERLAKAATPGEWRVAEDNNPFADGRHVFATGFDGTQFVVLNLKTDHTFVTATSREQQQKNAMFSAAANPATILKLIEAARQGPAEYEGPQGRSEQKDHPTPVGGLEPAFHVERRVFSSEVTGGETAYGAWSLLGPKDDPALWADDPKYQLEPLYSSSTVSTLRAENERLKAQIALLSPGDAG